MSTITTPILDRMRDRNRRAAEFADGLRSLAELIEEHAPDLAPATFTLYAFKDSLGEYLPTKTRLMKRLGAPEAAPTGAAYERADRWQLGGGVTLDLALPRAADLSTTCRACGFYTREHAETLRDTRGLFPDYCTCGGV